LADSSEIGLDWRQKTRFSGYAAKRDRVRPGMMNVTQRLLGIVGNQRFDEAVL